MGKKRAPHPAQLFVKHFITSLHAHKYRPMFTLVIRPLIKSRFPDDRSALFIGETAWSFLAFLWRTHPWMDERCPQAGEREPAGQYRCGFGCSSNRLLSLSRLRRQLPRQREPRRQRVGGGQKAARWRGPKRGRWRFQRSSVSPVGF